MKLFMIVIQHMDSIVKNILMRIKRKQIVKENVEHNILILKMEDGSIFNACNATKNNYKNKIKRDKNLGININD